LTGSNSCENFFSKVGGMLGMECAYDFHELVRATNTMNQLSEVEYSENGLQFGRVHNKMTNIWAKLYPLESGELKADLGDYTLVGTDDLLVEAMKKGLLEVQKILRSLNMAPSAVAKQKKWFTQPWIVERIDAKNFAYTPSKTLVADEDGDTEYLRHTLEIHAQNADDNLCNDDSPCQEAELTAKEFDAVEDTQHITIVEDEARGAIRDMLDEHEVVIDDPYEGQKIVPIVEYSGNVIFKSTLVS
jgi:hypothetical protein